MSGDNNFLYARGSWGFGKEEYAVPKAEYAPLPGPGNYNIGALRPSYDYRQPIVKKGGVGSSNGPGMRAAPISYGPLPGPGSYNIGALELPGDQRVPPPVGWTPELAFENLDKIGAAAPVNVRPPGELSIPDMIRFLTDFVAGAATEQDAAVYREFISALKTLELIKTKRKLTPNELLIIQEVQNEIEKKVFGAKPIGTTTTTDTEQLSGILQKETPEELREMAEASDKAVYAADAIPKIEAAIAEREEERKAIIQNFNEHLLEVDSRSRQLAMDESKFTALEQERNIERMASDILGEMDRRLLEIRSSDIPMVKAKREMDATRAEADKLLSNLLSRSGHIRSKKQLLKIVRDESSSEHKQYLKYLDNVNAELGALEENISKLRPIVEDDVENIKRHALDVERASSEVSDAISALEMAKKDARGLSAREPKIRAFPKGSVNLGYSITAPMSQKPNRVIINKYYMYDEEKEDEDPTEDERREMAKRIEEGFADTSRIAEERRAAQKLEVQRSEAQRLAEQSSATRTATSTSTSTTGRTIGDDQVEQRGINLPPGMDDPSSEKKKSPSGALQSVQD